MFEKIKNGFITGFSFAAGVISMTLLAVTVGNVNTFNSGEPLSSSKLNENFTNLKTAIEELNTELSTFKTSMNTDLESLKTSINTVNTELGTTKTDLSTTQTSLTSASTTLQATDTTLSGRVTTLENNVAIIKQVPVGTIIAYGSEIPPVGWLLCDGASYSRLTYSELYLVIKESFGGDTVNQMFNVPDLRGRFIRGQDKRDPNDPIIANRSLDPDNNSRAAMNSGGNTGNGIGSIQGDELKSHNHNEGAFNILLIVNGYSTAINTDFDSGYGEPNIGAFGTGRIQPTGGTETRPKNAYVNFIIKY